MQLVIETATAACSVALIDGGACVAEIHEIVGRGHAERLLPQVAALLEGRPAPTAIRVDCGPGSFTGVRVGLAAARALGLAWGVPVFGYSATALSAIGAFARHEGDALTVAMIGGHGEMFVQRFARAPFAALTDLASLTPGTAAAVAPDTLVVGSAAAALVAARGHGAAIDDLPRAADVRRLSPAFAALAPAPIYGRAPDAKVPAAA